MPLPMVHLGTAREYAKDIPLLLNCPEYYLGSISPDAIHMRKNIGRGDKKVTLLYTDEIPWKENVLNFLKGNRNSSNYSFLLGYGIHILTDIAWNETIYVKFQLAYEKDCAPMQDIKWAYYNDTDKLDFELYRVCKWREEIWNLLNKAKYFDITSILKADEINAWNSRTLHWFDSGESQHKNPMSDI